MVIEDKMCSTKLLSGQGLVLSKQTSLTVIISILGVESLFYYLMLERMLCIAKALFPCLEFYGCQKSS